MNKEYIRGNKKHWKKIYEWAFGRVPDKDWNEEGTCFVKNTCIMLKRNEGKLFVVDAKDRDDKVLYDIITTNPNWHEVKPWENKPYEPRPFDKVLGWDDYEGDACPDIFLAKSDIGLYPYCCARVDYVHVKPYSEEEYMRQLEQTKNHGKKK